MAHRRRHPELVPAVTDRENITIKPGKSHPIKQISLTKRPPLDELSNKLIDIKPKIKKSDPAQDQNEAPKPVQPAKKENHAIVKAFSSSQLTTVLEHDPKIYNDPQMASEYQDDIFKYLHELELKYPIKP
ncbi:hypothetical protein Zmor_005574 [Zophobas morio]|uniref:Uncharacterized protein n=1 Tax=Zophobas morio TaxID=2755281 RepID=A0AA38MLZ9_9CUCU|nr:hypothetical protein Zmor_005574 [Zophobas morio]